MCSPTPTWTRRSRAIAAGITLNTGQICAAGSRVVVDRSVHAEVVERLAERMSPGHRSGPGTEQVHMGPLINAKQHARVLEYVRLGREEGAELVTRRRRPSGEQFERGYFVEPTLFDRVDPDDAHRARRRSSARCWR